MHALHNGDLIREILPRSLTASVSLFTDRYAAHAECASRLHVTGPKKRAAAVLKSQATRARNIELSKTHTTAIATARGPFYGQA